MKRFAALPMIALATLACLVVAPTLADRPSEEAIRKLLQERIDRYQQSVGIVVGFIDADGRTVVGWGTKTRDGDERPDGATVFEIGSVTKAFTGTLLADQVLTTKIGLTTAVDSILPEAAQIPEKDGKAITLLDLATHTSSLPRLPGNLVFTDPTNPYADYSVDQMYAFLASYTLPRPIGSLAEYSNLGMGLLGHALALHAGTDYETLVRKRITKPLGMSDTSIALTDSMRQRLAPGHDKARKQVPNWDFPAMPGAGALRSTVNDILVFLEANLGLKRTPLAGPMELARQPQRPFGDPALRVGLAWLIQAGHDREIVWHNGETGGYYSFVGFDREAGTGVVVLSNSSLPIMDIGMHLLEPAYELRALVDPSQVADVSAEVFDAYVGRYQLAPQFILTVFREGETFYVQATGQPPIEVKAQSETHFVAESINGAVTFGRNADGEVDHLILSQGGGERRAERLGDDAAGIEAFPDEVELAAELLDRYPGRYQLAPQFVLTVTRTEDGLQLQATGQPSFPLFAESETQFFLKAVPAKVTFVLGDDGRAASLTLHQGGRDMPAPRIE